jgi:hypothetical protein
MKRPLRLGEGMRDEQGWHATDCQPIVSRRSIRVRQIHKRAKTLRILVGATGFEPATPCAQGRCATRLRYAPTRENPDYPIDEPRGRERLYRGLRLSVKLSTIEDRSARGRMGLRARF